MKHKQLPVNIYDCHLHVLVGTAVEINRWFKRNYPNPKRPDGQLSTWSVGQFTTWDPDDPKFHTEYFASVVTDRCVSRAERHHALVHELVHMAVRVLDDKGVTYTAGNDESLAYFYEWLYVQSIGMVG